jgi:hypothetical protein
VPEDRAAGRTPRCLPVLVQGEDPCHPLVRLNGYWPWSVGVSRLPQRCRWLPAATDTIQGSLAPAPAISRPPTDVVTGVFCHVGYESRSQAATFSAQSIQPRSLHAWPGPDCLDL